jgi:hypothetical protein
MSETTKPSELLNKLMNAEECSYLVELLWDARAYAESEDNEKEAGILDQIGIKLGLGEDWYDDMYEGDVCSDDCPHCGGMSGKEAGTTKPYMN